MNDLRRIGLMSLFLLFFLVGSAAAAAGAELPSPTPPRLSFIDGDVSYWRPGADDWAEAQPNLALAAGDAFYAGDGGRLEVQFGARNFARADEGSELSLTAQDERAIRFKLTRGRASFDIGGLAAGDTVEVSTPDAVFAIAHPGYYRLEVGADDTHFITRRGGEATVTTADGRVLSVYPSEDIAVAAGTPARLAVYDAPATDGWDRWNDERSERVGESISARYLPPSIYGADELDHAGLWRVAPGYGAVWIPYGVSADWAPYSTGYWVWDPYYEWTWVDEAPWGWAPFHYGRWIRLDGSWAWAPGPVVRRPLYAPALVAFVVGSDGTPVHPVAGAELGWVALGWGEPVLPWWGPAAYRGQPRWSGWGGPRVVNNVVIRPTTVVHARDIRFRNASLPRAIVAVPADKFGRERIHPDLAHEHGDVRFTPVHGRLPVARARASLFGGAPKGVAPPRASLSRPVVSVRAPDEAVARAVSGRRDGVAPKARERVSAPLEAGPRTLPRRSDAAAAPGTRPLPFRQSEGRTPMSPPPPPSPRVRDEARAQSPAREDATRRRAERPAARPERPAGMPSPGRPTPPDAQPPRPRTGPPPVIERAFRPEPASAPRAGEGRPERAGRPLPGEPVNRPHGRRDRENGSPP
ncbi:MAG: FecR domain-containing protein [Betaproteobacteria bacterium]|nr:FecR domain-containing protein [Betaproteobacteria bacterium]